MAVFTNQMGLNLLMTPEDGLLLSAARAWFQSEPKPFANALQSQALDWTKVRGKAEAHGILPLLLHQIETCCPGAVPPAELERLRARYHEYELRSVVMARDLIRLLEFLESRGIRAIPFKGPALSSYLYGDPAMRRSDDLDLLIHAEDFWRVAEALESRGFAQSPQITRGKMRAYARSECDVVFDNRASGLRVEIHWDLVPPYHGMKIPMMEFWDRLETSELLGIKVPMLSAEDHLIALCIHASKHLWRRMEWTCSIAALLRRAQQPDLEEAFQRAKRWGSDRVLLLGLMLTRELTGMALPAPALSRVSTLSSVESLAHEVWKGVFSDATPGFMELTRFRLHIIDSPWSRIGYCIKRATLPSYVDLRWVDLPRPLFFLYFFLRPIRLAADLARIALSHSGSRLDTTAAPSARKGSC